MHDGRNNEAATRRFGPSPPAAAARAFTLLEMLVVIAVIGVLVATLLPALSSAREMVKSLQCSSNMKSVAMRFDLFARGEAPTGRGDSHTLGQRRFWINDFQESLYGIDEFWDAGTNATAHITAADTVMLCPDAAPRLTKHRGYPCSSEALRPAADVSLACNMRLYRASIDFRGKRMLAPAAATHVTTNILHHPYVPLIFDVNGAEAAQRGLEPFYTAPPLKSAPPEPYTTGRYWFASDRHNGKTNVAFVGGHVLTSTDPQKEAWDWSYQAAVGR